MIPKSQLWNVTYWYGSHESRTKKTWQGYAPTRQFALWNARDEMGWLNWYNAVKVTASVVQKRQKRYARIQELT